MSPIKNGAIAVLNFVPLCASKFVAKKAALAPPSLKVPIFERICTRIACNLVQRVEFLETNMGISSRLRCQMPTSKFQYLFGRPENNIAERSTCELVRQLFADCCNFVDVGANEGLFTYLASAFGGKNLKLHFFEPDQTLFHRLSENLKSNGIETQGNALATAAQTGHATFYRNLDDDSSGSLTDYFSKVHRTRQETVQTISLGDYFATYQIDKAIVKIDVEGAGSEVWSGLKNAAEKIEYLIIEIIEPEVKSDLPARIISQTGWRAYYIRDFDLIESVGGEFVYVPPFWNWLFCRLAPEALAEKLAGTKFQVMASPA